jgi:hypothetical protein
MPKKSIKGTITVASGRGESLSADDMRRIASKVLRSGEPQVAGGFRFERNGDSVSFERDFVGDIQNLLIFFRERCATALDSEADQLETVDAALFASRALKNIENIEQCLPAFDRIATCDDTRRDAYMALLGALHLALNSRFLALVDNEPAIVARGRSIIGGRQGARDANKARREKHERIRAEFTERRAAGKTRSGIISALAEAYGLTPRQIRNIVPKKNGNHRGKFPR